MILFRQERCRFFAFGRDYRRCSQFVVPFFLFCVVRSTIEERIVDKQKRHLCVWARIWLPDWIWLLRFHFRRRWCLVLLQ